MAGQQPRAWWFGYLSATEIAKNWQLVERTEKIKSHRPLSALLCPLNLHITVFRQKAEHSFQSWQCLDRLFLLLFLGLSFLSFAISLVHIKALCIILARISIC